MRSKYDP
jgi:hypothetical protein